MKKFIFGFGLFLIFHSTVTAQQKLNLSQAVSIALKENMQISVAKNSAEIARNTASAAKAEILPRFSVSGGVNYTDSDAPGVNSGIYTTSSVGANISYTIFDGMGNIYRLKKVLSTGRMGLIEARKNIENTILLVGQAYYQAASSFEGLNIAVEALQISKERFKRAEEKNVYGSGTSIDVLSANVAVNTDSVNVVNSIFLWNQARRNLNELLNREIKLQFTVDTTVTFLKIENLENLLFKAEKENAEYLIAIEQKKQAKYSKISAFSQMLPRFDLTGSVGYSRTGQNNSIGFDNMSKTIRAGLNVSLPVFNGGQMRIAFQNSKLLAENQSILEKLSKRRLERSVINAYEAYKNSRLLLKLETQNLKAAELNFKRTHDLYQLGQVTTTQFREAQLNLIKSKNVLQTSKYSAKINELKLKQITGDIIVNSEIILK